MRPFSFDFAGLIRSFHLGLLWNNDCLCRLLTELKCPFNVRQQFFICNLKRPYYKVPCTDSAVPIHPKRRFVLSNGAVLKTASIPDTGTWQFHWRNGTSATLGTDFAKNHKMTAMSIVKLEKTFGKQPSPNGLPAKRSKHFQEIEKTKAHGATMCGTILNGGAKWQI